MNERLLLRPTERDMTTRRPLLALSDFALLVRYGTSRTSRSVGFCIAIAGQADDDYPRQRDRRLASN